MDKPEPEPQPLKGKIPHELFDYEYFRKHDIKSAIEWYQYNLRILIMDLSEKKITFIEFNEKQKELIKEAFEDVTNSQNKPE